VITRKLRAVRNSREDRAGIWALHTPFLVLAVEVVSSFFGTVRDFIGSAGSWIVSSAMGPARPGLPDSSLDRVSLIGHMDRVWRNSRMVYADLLGLGRGRSSGR
jgi:hypothetical protein